MEMEAAAAAAAAAEGVEEPNEMFAALLQQESDAAANNKSFVQGDFIVLHKVKEEIPEIETESAAELQVCFGEMLWHPQPPLLIACRSLWAAPQRMRLTKAANNSAAAAEAAAAAAATAAGTAAAANFPKEFLVLSDVEEGDTTGSAAADEGQDPLRAGDWPRAAVEVLKESLSDRQTLRRIAADTAEVSVQSLRNIPATFARLSNATADVFYK
ncbi:hypothetical protein, conserved [Eimeria brunetti]|uniref:Uncharacterized protein n=1 Tax=Eimeria brunetti TaxID=51314 RepID=U6L668_9EIME|nr:hypothetical protein, conserved [Eimeria brunetti]